jgi:hypothetical protein
MLRGESGVHPYVIVKSAPGANTSTPRLSENAQRIHT